MFKIPPKTNSIVNQCIEYIKKIDDNIFDNGPVQFLFPQVFDENIKQLSENLTAFPFPIKIFFAHKSNKSKVFVKESKKTGISIDVASLNELKNAIDSGFKGKDIECTGIKNIQFIKQSLKEDCLIIIDSISEFDIIKTLTSINKRPRVAFRINDPYCNNGCYNRTSRFGIKKQEFIDLVNKEYMNNFQVEGLHLHFDEYVPENKANMIKELVSLYKHLFEKNIFPKMLNIGGGYRFLVVEPKNKDKLLEEIENINFDDVAYAKTMFGLEKGRNGKISKTLLSDKFFPLDSLQYLTKVFDYLPEKKQLINDLNLNVHIEPGYSLLDSCGIIVMKVIGTKNLGENRFAIVVDGNMYNLSTQMRKWITDPIHISKNNNLSKKPCDAFIFGNLCKEDDVLLDRKVNFDRKPEIGDLLVFINTAGYAGNFEDTDAILQPKNKNFVYLIENSKSIILTEKEYLEQKK